MGAYLQTQLSNAEEIRNILKKVPVSYQLADGRKVTTLLVYLPTKDGVSNHFEFFEKIKEGILYNFVFSCKEIEKKLGLKNKEEPEKLFLKAIRKLSQHTAKGELGELILFTLLDVYLNAPKILSKVSMKQSRRMPVFGADAVHGQFFDGEFQLYLGESKLYTDFKGAASEAVSSIKNSIENYEQEFDLLDSHMDFPNINEDLESKLIDILNPFSGNDLSCIIQLPCFIGFAEPELISNSKSDKEFLKGYTKLACGYVSNYFDKFEKQGLDINTTTLLMLPFSCPDELEKGFISHLGIEK